MMSKRNGYIEATYHTTTLEHSEYGCDDLIVTGGTDFVEVEWNGE